MTFPLLPQHTDECSFDFSCPVAFEIREVVGGAGPDLVLTSTWGGEALVEIAQHGNPTNVEQQLSLGKTSGNALAGIDRVPFLSWLLALQVEGIIKIHSYVGLTDACRETMELYARAVNISVEEGVIGG